MNRRRRRSSLCFCALTLLVLVSAPGIGGAGTSVEAPWPPSLHRGARLSAAYERMLRDQIEAGRVLSPETLRQFGLDRPEFDATLVAAPADVVRRAGRPAPAGITALLPDVQVNDRSGDATCGSCAGRPLGQAETTIASLGDRVLVGWNDTKGFCTGSAVQGYGYSSDGGATWVDGGDVPALGTGGRYRGDPVHAVNRKTGDFYICGLYEGGAFGSGLALARGRFTGGSFVFDANRQIAVGGPRFLDKEWVAVDSLSGNIYVSYTVFASGTDWIEFIRSTDNGLTWSAPIVMNAPSANGLVQGSRPAVGPDGEVYVVWYEFGFPQSHMRIRRSDDFGASFGSEATVCDFYENGFSGAPGFRRPFGIALPGIAVDASEGPHRGRVYVAWDESVNFWDAPFASATAQSEIENNDFFAGATPFDVGDVLRGTMITTGDVDVFSFWGLRGQTLYFRGDSSSSAAVINARLVCSSDTSNFNAYRLQAFTQSDLPSLVFTLPADGTYYLRLSVAAGSPLSYVINTTFDTPSAGERARDHRDRFISHSDDGATWSAPVMLNDDDPWFDGTFPEVTVDGTGAVHCFWHDFRDDAGCGAESFEYMVSSGDGGVTWGPNRRVSDDRSFWSFNACGSANQGDYQGITSEGATVRPCWADSRLGDPDVFTEGPTFAHASACPDSDLAAAGSTHRLSFEVENQGTVDGDFEWTVEDDLGWLAGAIPGISGSVSLGPGGTGAVAATFSIPSACPPQPNLIRFITRDPSIPGRADTCEALLYCVSATAAAEPPAALALEPPRPNPTSSGTQIGFSLSRHGPVKLEVFSASGARVRTLASGAREAGRHSLSWDGRDARGRAVGAGVYYVRLEAEGRSLRRPLTLVR